MMEPQSHGEQETLLLDDMAVTMPDAALLLPHPFQSEEDYWALIQARLQVRKQLLAVQPRGPLYRTTEHQDDSVPGRGPEYQETLDARYRQLLAVQRARVACTPPDASVPRLRRLAARYHLTELECDVLHYLLLLQCAPTVRAPGGGAACSVEDVAQFVGLELPEACALLDPTLPLLGAGLIRISARPVETPLQRTVHMDWAVVKALRDLPLTDDEYATLLAHPASEVLLDDEPAWLPEAALPEASEAREVSPPPREAPASGGDENGSGRTTRWRPYTTDIEYLEEHFAWFAARYHRQALQEEREDARHYDHDLHSTQLREAHYDEQVWYHRITERIRVTQRAGAWMPCAERLAAQRQLDAFEKHVLLLLTGITISKALQRAIQCRGSLEVGDILDLFCASLDEQVHARAYFYRTAPLLRDTLITLDSPPFSRDLVQSTVSIDRRLVDLLLGLETEAASLIEGTHLYRPRVSLEHVILPAPMKELIVKTVTEFPAFQVARERYLDQRLEYGRGLVLLFTGPSGTGKTMLANALASHLGKRLLLVNFHRIGQLSSDQTLRYLFREAKISDSVIFFDEADGLFESRDRANGELSLLLSELERHAPLVIMATNRPGVLDPALHRRITLAVEFRCPDALERVQIWRAHLPPDLPCDGPLDLEELAYRYELTGGLVKNAVLHALALATARTPAQPRVCQADLDHGARLQIQSKLSLSTAEGGDIPHASVDDLILPASLRAQLQVLIDRARVRCSLLTTWGFADTDLGLSTTALFVGPCGVGKRMAAAAVADALGRPLRRFNAAQLGSHWGERGLRALERICDEARQQGVVLVLEDIDKLGDGRSMGEILDTPVLLRTLARFSGVAILITDMRLDMVDPTLCASVHLLEFPLPDETARAALWRRHVPRATPLANDVRLDALAAFSLTGLQIRDAVLKAAMRAAVRPPAYQCVTQTDLVTAATEEARASSPLRLMGFQGSAVAHGNARS